MQLPFARSMLAEFGLYVIAPHRTVAQLLSSATCFVVAYSLSLLSNPVRNEIQSFISLLRKSEAYCWSRLRIWRLLHCEAI